MDHDAIINALCQMEVDCRIDEKPTVQIPSGTRIDYMYMQITPLQMAVVLGLYHAAEYLLDQGELIEEIASNENRAIHFGAEAGNPAILDLLLKQGAIISAPGCNGVTALELAAANGNIEAVKILVQAGADLEACNDSGITPIISAATGGYVDIVEYLIAKGANIDKSSVVQGTALNAATYSGHFDTVIALVKAGADLEATTQLGRTALTIAAFKGHTAIVQFLLSKGARCDVNDSTSFNPMDHAICRNHYSCVLAIARYSTLWPYHLLLALNRNLAAIAELLLILGTGRFTVQSFRAELSDTVEIVSRYGIRMVTAFKYEHKSGAPSLLNLCYRFINQHRTLFSRTLILPSELLELILPL